MARTSAMLLAVASAALSVFSVKADLDFNRVHVVRGGGVCVAAVLAGRA